MNRLNRPQNIAFPDMDAGAQRPPQAAVFIGLKIYLVTLLALTTAAWMFIALRAPALNRSYLHTTLFCCPNDPFSDFTDFNGRIAHFGEPDMLSRTDLYITYPYPTPSIYAFLPFVRLSYHHSLRVYLVFALLSFCFAACVFSWRIKQTAPGYLPQLVVWSTLLFGFPMWFLLDRANIEGIIWLLVLAGTIAFSKERMLACALLWAAAASMKIFPGLFFALFLAKRNYRMFALAIAATFAFTLLALAGVGPTIREAASASSQGAPFLLKDYILAVNLPQFDHSLFAAVKQVIYVHFHGIRSAPLLPQIQLAFEKALRIYNILVVAGVALLYWFRLRRMPVLNQFMAYVVMCVLFPYVSNEYTLVHVYLAWGAFLLFLLDDVVKGRVQVPSKAIYTILFSCAGIFAPLGYVQVGSGTHFGGQIKMVFLALVLITVLKVPMPSSLFRDLPAQLQKAVPA